MINGDNTKFTKINEGWYELVLKLKNKLISTDS